MRVIELTRVGGISYQSRGVRWFAKGLRFPNGSRYLSGIHLSHQLRSF